MTHDHVALENRPESLEQTTPAWVEDFAFAVSEDAVNDDPVDSLLPLLQDSTVVNNRLVFSEAPWVHRGHHRSLRDGNSTLYDFGTGEVELFLVAEEDPFEYEDLSLTLPELVVDMHRRLLEFMTAGGLLRGDLQEEARELGSEEIEALRALGYVD